jgi:hypothetical protein
MKAAHSSEMPEPPFILHCVKIRRLILQLSKRYSIQTTFVFVADLDVALEPGSSAYISVFVEIGL